CASDFKRGPLVQISTTSPWPGCDPGGFGPGPFPDNVEIEPHVAVNPLNPKNVVAVWSAGRFRGMVTAVSFYGGRGWQQVPVPGLSVCLGGTAFEAVTDERIAFAANGDLYLITGAFNRTHVHTGTLVSKSTDSGLHWSVPAVLSETTDPHDDGAQPLITGDPTDARFVYAVWDGSSNGHRGPTVFTRTTDAGHTWEPTRTIVSTDPQDYVQMSQLLFLPDGTLVNAYELVNVKDSGHGIQQDFSLQVIRSADHGQTWSSPALAVTMLPLYGGDI